MGYLSAGATLLDKARGDCAVCYSYFIVRSLPLIIMSESCSQFEAVYDEAYFVPLATTSMALVARIHFALGQMLDEVGQRMEVYSKATEGE